MSNTFLNETNARNDANLSCQFIIFFRRERERERERKRELYLPQSAAANCTLSADSAAHQHNAMIKLEYSWSHSLHQDCLVPVLK